MLAVELAEILSADDVHDIVGLTLSSYDRLAHFEMAFVSFVSPMTAQAFDQLIDFRQTNRRFDSERAVPDGVIEKGIRHATLAPNSSNMQLWEFHWVQDAEMKKQLVRLCLGQMAAHSAAELVVFVTRRDRWKERVAWHKAWIDQDVAKGADRGVKQRRQYYGTLMPLVYRRDWFRLSTLVRRVTSWAMSRNKPMYRFGGRASQRVMVHKSCALAAQNFMMSMASEGLSTCPMEGFDEPRVKRLLKLSRGAEVNMVIAVGYGTEKGIWNERRRVSMDDVLRRH